MPKRTEPSQSAPRRLQPSTGAGTSPKASLVALPVPERGRVRPWLFAVGLLLALIDVAMPLWVYGGIALGLLQCALTPVGLAVVVSGLRPQPNARRPERAPYGLLVLASAAFITCLASKGSLLQAIWFGMDPHALGASYRTLAVLTGLTWCALLAVRPRPVERVVRVVGDYTARATVGTFAVTTLIGAFLLTLPIAVRDVRQISFVDALFTSASSVCVTGLAVNVISRTYTPFGQAVILALVQVGGLGIMVLYGFFAVLAGRRLSTRHATAMAELVDVNSMAELRRTLAGIVLFTLLIEAAGALVLYQAFQIDPDVLRGPEVDAAAAGAGNLWWAAVFHSVSAFCNAGFSLFRDNLMPFRGDFLVSLTIAALIVIGGLGFPVWFELFSRVVTRLRGRRPTRLSLHTRSVLVASAALILIGTLAFLILEAFHTQSGMPWWERVLTSLFQSVVTRTAGFNTLDFSAMAPATWLMTCVLMFIGASPGSTGGGIKTTTFTVLVASLRAELRGRSSANLWGRSVGPLVARKAFGVTLLSLAVVVALVFLMLLTERFDALRLTFEVVSALATVGLSTGITPELSTAGKLLIVLAMFLGRVGPLTLAIALARNQEEKAAPVELPEERIGIG
jgi:trk system potassium uptake protein TrkH